MDRIKPPLKLQMDTPSPEGGRAVAGTVAHADGAPIAGMLVRAYHRRVAGADLLGETRTTDRGEYRIRYALPAGASAVDLFARALDDAQAVVGVSAIIIGAGPQERLTLTVEDDRFRGPSEFARTGEAVGASLAGIALELVNGDDVALLVRRTGVSRIAVTAWIASRRLAERTGLDHEALYALVRTANTASLPRLLRRSPARLRRALAAAVRGNIVSRAAGQRADAIGVQLERAKIATSASRETPGSLGRLLATAGQASPEQQRRFIERHAGHRGPVRDLWRALRTDPGFGNEVVDDLQLSVQLGALTANHPPMVAALRASGVRRASDTATLTADQWRELARRTIDGGPVGAPANLRGDTDAARVDTYVALLTERAALAFPTPRVAATLKALPEWGSSPAVAFLDANPAFNLTAANIEATLASSGVVIQPDWDLARLASDLATAQRVTRVAPRGQEAAVVSGLLAHGYTSAFAISRTSRDAFVRRTAGALGGAAVATEVHRTAQFQASRAVSAYAMMHPLIGGPLVAALGNLSAKVTGEATWASLFGSLDYCTCEHCRSIYSPAAYLVDLLAWLDGHDLNGTTAFARLDARRPDIARLELSCENTNTVLPYVDLVNEILEVRVLNPSGAEATGPAVPPASTATTPELLANPEHLHPEAYDRHLARAVFPDLLPFDLWGELGRVYFQHLGVRRSDLMEALSRPAVPGRAALSAERLGLSPEQWRILSGAARHDVWESWGYQEAAPGGTDFKQDLAVVSTFLERARLQYGELLDLLHTRFANPGGMAIAGASCNTDAMTIGPLTDEDLARIDRFLRLRRNRGWSMLDLDKALHALEVTALDAPALARLADLDRVQALTRAPLLDVLSWWSTIDTFADRPEQEQPVMSLYDRVFLNRAVDAAAEEPGFPLALDATRSALASAVPWDDVRSLLQAALAIDADDLARLIDETVNDLPNAQRVVTGTTATLEGLSALYRHVSLARALRLRVGELLGVLRLTGVDPFAAGDTGATVAMIETVAELRAAPLSLDELHYLLEHDAEAETRVGVTDEAIGQTLIEMRDGLARIAADFAVTADPTGDVTARYLAALLEADAVAAVMAALRTPADGLNDAGLAAVLTAHLGSVFTGDAAALVARPVEQRFAALVGALGPRLQETQASAVIIEKVATFAGRDLNSVEDLLSLRLGMTVDGRGGPALAGLRTSPYVSSTVTALLATDDPAAFAALRRAHKAALVLTRLGIDIDEQRWLFDVGVPGGLLSPLALPVAARPLGPGAWQAWARLVDLCALRTELSGGEPRLVELLQLLESPGDSAIAEETFRTELAARTGWRHEDLDTLIAAFAPVFPRDWRDGRTLRRLVDAFQLIRRAGVSAAQADGWVTARIAAAQAEELRLAAKSKHDEERWPAVARALRDPVREKQRAALVAHLIARNPRWADEADLYADLLIDVEMDPCMLTSRLKQAISSVQLFVQRAFLNLEGGIALTRDDRDQWEWMKTYRVWEAARKVFLYPENWTEPELRTTRSPLFEALENALRQGELTDAAVEKAYTAYLEGLLKIARLEVMGLYHQFEADEDGTIDVLHVVARTKGHPHEHYYRQWIDGREWTPWERLDLDIEGDHIVLAVHDRRLYVFWPVVVQKATGTSTSTTEFYEVKLAWVERLNGAWGARHLSEEYLTIDGEWESDEDNTFFRLGRAAGLIIEHHDNVYARRVQSLGQFAVDTCTGGVTAETAATTTAVDLVAPEGTRPDRMRFTHGGADNDSAGVALVLPAGQLAEDGELVGILDEVEVLAAARGAFSYAYPHQYGEFASQHGIFLDDDERTFHVMPQPAFDWARLLEPDEADPSAVGTQESGSDAFTRPEREDDYTPDLPWDKQQEPDLTSQLTPAGPPAPPELAAGAAADTAPGARVAALAGAATGETLTAAALQASQTQLGEAAHTWDPLLTPNTATYRFSLFYHPYACDFMTELRRAGVAGLLDPNPDGPAATLVRQQRSRPAFFASTYQPTASALEPYPIQDIDFAMGGAYADYNWELFFHAPMLIASWLARDQRFEEARRWFHFIFDPTSRSDDRDPLRFWKIKPFYREADAPISEFLALAASADDSAEASAAREQYDQQVSAWLEDPFDPHAIARLRTTAYQKALVMKYLDNLIAWGDHLFRQDTIESLNEATQLYVLALELLGERPDALPPRTEPPVATFEQVRQGLAISVLNNPLVQLENLIPTPRVLASSVSGITAVANGLGPLILAPSTPGSPRAATAAPAGAGNGFYFGIPPNEKLLGYWDTVEDRLFKIRHCMNIEGVVRQLPLFEPPIDPGLLVRARAAGIDLASALADLNAPLPHYRFGAMLQKAYALTGTVRGLGGALLSALEKQDAEALALLRANQEVALLEAVRQVKALAIDEAHQSLAAAERSLEATNQRRDYYAGLLSAGWLGAEKLQLGLHLTAGGLQAAASLTSLIAAALAPVPRVTTGASGTMGTPVATADPVDGAKLAKALELGAQSASLLSAASMTAASVLGITAGYTRRAQEWQQQRESATLEIKQIERQIEAARIRLALAERDRENHERQTEHARSVRQFMEQKFTSADLYQWMVGQLSSLYFQSYQLAYDLAKQAERAYQHELALPDATFIQFGYWDSLKKGLLAGERLQFDLERMDAAYLENNRREYEITQHVSLALLDPVALLALQTAGEAEFSIPEALFDLSYPGQYLRRLKSVSVTVPSVAGPYSGVPLRLTLLSSRTRIDPGAAGDYPYDPAGEDGRFQRHTGAVQSIAVSGGRDDAGLFAVDHRDERYLPFEGSGAISDWTVTLTSAVPTFDWSTITDVVLHVRYTAREGGDLLREAALQSLAAGLAGIPLRRAFSARREFPTQWSAFLRPTPSAARTVLTLDLVEDRFPYIAQGAGLAISELQLVARVKDPGAWASMDVDVTTAHAVQTVSLTSSPDAYAGHPSAVVGYAGGAAPGTWEISVPVAPLGAPSSWAEDMVVVATYQIDPPGLRR